MSEIKDQGQGTLFNNPALEALTKSPPPVSWGYYFIIDVCLLIYGVSNSPNNEILLGAGIFIGAFFFWSFFEYFFHRYINHLDEHFPESKFAHRLAYMIHGVHHEYPRDKERVIMPPIPGTLIAATVFGIIYLLMGSYAFFFMPGFLAGYLLYTYIHYTVHKKHVPSLLKTLYRHHALHHYKYPEKAFGVTTTLWDRVFGTMPPN